MAAAQGVYSLDGNAAEGEVIGELPIGDGKCGEIVAQPAC
jgi:hypothetical protein